MRERLRTYLENSPGVRAIQRAAESEFYPALVCLLVFMAYCSDYEMLFATVLIAFASVTLILFRDLKTLLPPLFMFTFALTLKHAPRRPTYSDYYFQTPVLVSFAILILVLLTALVLHYVIWGGFTAMFRKKTRLTWFILPLTVALLCNGLFAEGYAPINITYSIALVFVWIFLYLVFRFGLSPGEETVRYFTVSCQWTAILLILELFYVYVTRDVLVDGIIVEGRIFLGWGINNNYGAAMTILLPALFYLAYTRKNGWIQFLLIVAAFAATVLSMCRAALLVGAVIFLAGFITGCFYGTNRNLFRLLLGVSLATGAVTLIALRTQIIETFSFLFRHLPPVPDLRRRLQCRDLLRAFQFLGRQRHARYAPQHRRRTVLRFRRLRRHLLPRLSGAHDSAGPVAHERQAFLPRSHGGGDRRSRYARQPDVQFLPHLLHHRSARPH